MSGIQGLSSDQQQVYNQLINDAGTVNVSRAAVDKELQVAMDAGLSFQEAAAQVRNDLPTLTPPKSPSGSLGGWVGVASPMASINALITEMSAEQRKENREVMKAQTDSIAMSMEQQADEIRKKAVAQLVCGVVSGAINIGMGAVQFGMGMKQLNMGKQQGALLAKGRLLGIQFDVLFTDDLYTKISKNAIDTANALKKGLAAKGCRFFMDSPTNQVFVVLENTQLAALEGRAKFGFWEKFDDTHTVVRIATSWATRKEEIEQLIALM